MKTILHRAAVLGIGASLIWAMPAAARGRGNREVRNPVTTNQIVDQADARIATLKANLRLTSDEDKNWDGFQSALHDIAVQRANTWNNIHEQRTVASGNPQAPVQQPDANAGNAAADNSAATKSEAQNPPNNALNDNTASDTNNTTKNTPSAIDNLREEANALNRRADELKKIADAAQPLYASLDDTQRRQLMTFIYRDEAGTQGAEFGRR
jgi:hypothetical protein